MRTHGTLTQWNDDRGFGFITPAGGDKAFFVHISAFPRDGQRPQIGELVSFETETGRDNKLRAVRVMRPRNRAKPAHATRPVSASHARAGWGSTLILIAAVCAIGVYVYKKMGGTPVAAIIGKYAAPHAAVRFESIKPRPQASENNFHCDGRTMCSQMSSCDEAIYFVQHCPGTKMDGDGDGLPCEQQWCG